MKKKKNKHILLLDRDGVINLKATKSRYVNHWRDFQWNKNTLSALKTFAEAKFQFIVITNQAGVGRGITQECDLVEIHENMRMELKMKGIEVLAIYVCPHKPDEGCDCRKPEPGNLLKATSDYQLPINQLVFVGDDPKDSLAAHKAGCQCAYIGPESELATLEQYALPMFKSTKLTALTDKIIQYYESNAQSI